VASPSINVNEKFLNLTINLVTGIGDLLSKKGGDKDVQEKVLFLSRYLNFRHINSFKPNWEMLKSNGMKKYLKSISL